MTPKRWLAVFYGVVVLACIVGCVGVSMDSGGLRAFLIFAGFGLAVAAVILHLFQCSCSSCGCHLRALGFFTDFCPYCGKLVD
jgi:hypothetical protein